MDDRWHRWIPIVWLILASAVGRPPAGAGTAAVVIREVAAVTAGEPRLAAEVDRLRLGGQAELVLNLESLGLAAMRIGSWRVAEAALDAALETIENFYVDSEKAAKARSLWYEEGSKDFLGEPYERAMAYLYRGVLHLRRGEYDDARATLRAGMLQDAFAEDEQYRCDFALLVYLYGLASQAVGDRVGTEDALAEAAALMPHLEVRPRSSTRYLLIAESGSGPRKIADGLGHGELKYAAGRDAVERDLYLVRGRSRREASMYEDLYFQASTRGGRAVDKIIEGKVVYRDRVAGAGAGLAEAARGGRFVGVAADSTEAMAAAGGIGLVAGIAKLVAAKVKPRADTRHWTNLPGQVSAFELPESAAAYLYRVVYLDAMARELPALGRILELPPCHLPLCTVFVPRPSPETPRSQP